MKLPVEKLETKNYTIGQKVCLSYVTEEDAVINKLATVMAITNETLVVSCVGEEFVFYQTTKSICGNYVLFDSTEDFKAFVKNAHKFEEVKAELMDEIGELADGLNFEDVESLIDAVKMIKKCKSMFKPEEFQAQEHEEEELEDEVTAEELDKSHILKDVMDMVGSMGVIPPMPDVLFKDILKEVKLEEMADFIKGNPMNIDAKEAMNGLADILSQFPFKGAKVIKFPKE